MTENTSPKPDQDHEAFEEIAGTESYADELDDASDAAQTQTGTGADTNIDTKDQTIVALEEQLLRAKDQTMRALAEMENTRKRAQKDREDASKFAISSFARDLLDFADNFSRAIAAIPDEAKQDQTIAGIITGIDAMEKELLRTFDKHGIQKIEPTGEMFDPNFHEVMFETPGTGQPAGTIIQVIEPGYILKERLLRPARVGIAKAEDGSNEPGSHVDAAV